MFQYRQVLVRLRQGDSDRDIARSGLMGRPKVAVFRLLADAQGWLKAEAPLPDDAAIAAVHQCAASCEQHGFKRSNRIASKLSAGSLKAFTGSRSTRRYGASTDFAAAIPRSGGCSRKFMPVRRRRRPCV